MYEILVNSGYCFLNEEDNQILLENKFTGTRVAYNETTDTYRVI